MKASAEQTKAVVIDDTKLKSEVSKLALDCFKAIGASSYGRIDIRCDSDGKPYFLEANLIPSIIEGSGNFQKACELRPKITFDKMLLRIIDLGFKSFTPYVAPPLPTTEPKLATSK
jgi:D-alanine-D-alanine ligase-like ATP-grasp enzyme